MREIMGAPHGLAVLFRSDRPPLTITQMKAAHSRFASYINKAGIDGAVADSIMRFIGNVYRSIPSLENDHSHAYHMVSFWSAALQSHDGRILYPLNKPPYIGLIRAPVDDQLNYNRLINLLCVRGIREGSELH